MAAIAYMQSDPAYRAEPAHAQSHVKHILRSPAHYQAALKRKFAPTLSMQIGSAVHCLVLEGEEQFAEQFVLKPEGLSLNTKAGKEWKVQNEKKIALSKTDQYASWDAVHGMAASLKTLDWFDPQTPDYRKFNELSLYWHADDLDCKCRIDRLLLYEDRAIIVDLKSTDDVAPSDFLKKIIGEMNYLFQAAWYTEGVERCFNVPTTFAFVGIERKPPYCMKIFYLDLEMIEEGAAQVAAARRSLSNCQRTKVWPAPPVEHVTLSLPPYYHSPLERATLESTSDPLDQIFGMA